MNALQLTSCSYLHVRLLLLRPFVSAVITLEPTSSSIHRTTTSLPWDISLRCAVACVKVAQDVVSTVQLSKTGSTASWWFNVLFVYTAATVLIASLLSPSIGDEISEASILVSWHSALEILDGYSTFGPSITRLVTTLHVLFDTVPKHHSHRKRRRQQINITQPPMSRSRDAPIGPRDDGRTVAWLDNSTDFIPGSTIPGVSGERDMEQDLAFSPLPAGFWTGVEDPFDLAWLTDLPPDLTF